MNPGSVSSADRVPPPMAASASSTVVRSPAFARTIAAVSPFGPEPITYASFGDLRIPLLMGVLPFEPTLLFEHFAERTGLQRYRRKVRSYIFAFPPQPALPPLGRIRKVILIQKRADVARRLI